MTTIIFIQENGKLTACTIPLDREIWNTTLPIKIPNDITKPIIDHNQITVVEYSYFDNDGLEKINSIKPILT